MSEAQALTAARVLSGRLKLPSDDQMQEDEKERLDAVGDTYKFHKMRYPLDADYGDMLRSCKSCEIDAAIDKSLTNQGVWKLGLKKRWRNCQSHGQKSVVIGVGGI